MEDQEQEEVAEGPSSHHNRSGMKGTLGVLLGGSATGARSAGASVGEAEGLDVEDSVAAEDTTEAGLHRRSFRVAAVAGPVVAGEVEGAAGQEEGHREAGKPWQTRHQANGP